MRKKLISSILISMMISLGAGNCYAQEQETENSGVVEALEEIQELYDQSEARLTEAKNALFDKIQSQEDYDANYEMIADWLDMCVQEASALQEVLHEKNLDFYQYVLENLLADEDAIDPCGKAARDAMNDFSFATYYTIPNAYHGVIHNDYMDEIEDAFLSYYLDTTIEEHNDDAFDDMMDEGEEAFDEILDVISYEADDFPFAIMMAVDSGVRDLDQILEEAELPEDPAVLGTWVFDHAIREGAEVPLDEFKTHHFTTFESITLNPDGHATGKELSGEEANLSWAPINGGVRVAINRCEIEDGLLKYEYKERMVSSDQTVTIKDEYTFYYRHE